MNTAKEDLDFLGFTFYNTQTRKGRYRVGIRTSNESSLSHLIQSQMLRKILYTTKNKGLPLTQSEK